MTKATTRTPRIVAGDVVYVVAPNSFRVDVCKVHEIITRKSAADVVTQYHVMWSDGRSGATGPDTLVFKRSSDVTRHLLEIAQANIDKVMSAIDDRRRTLGWDDDTRTEERTLKEKTTQ